MENWTILTLLTFIACSHQQQTPVIGGSCDLGSTDIQIGGKKTQFYLRCEPKDGGLEGKGTWVVKSRSKALSQEQEKYKAPMKKMMPSVAAPPSACAHDATATEGLPCNTPETCLQVVTSEPSAYLQCDSSTHIWIKRHCQPGLIFSFDQQLCLGQKRHVARQAVSGGILCTYSGCSNSNPCQVGSCNNGYCCSAQGSTPIVISSGGNSGCGSSCSSNSGYNSITICPNGGTPYGTCIQGQCASGYSCTNNNVCCPSSNSGGGYTAYMICPSGTTSGGSCYNGQCGSGCSCNTQSNTCCCQQSIFCPDGTQAAGACVNGQCGAGFSCLKGLCCAATSQTPKCLDGSEAIGACIDCKCGAGYICTTGNLCCPATTNVTNVCPSGQVNIGPCVNGICPQNGYTCVNNNCCGNPAVSCPAGQNNAGICLQGACPDNYTCIGGTTCCGTGTVTTCPTGSENRGPCVMGNCETGAICLGSNATYAGICCLPSCPADLPNQLGPCMNGGCQTGATCVGNICCGAGCPTGTEEHGPCLGGTCPTPGDTCIGGTTCCGAPIAAVTCDATTASGPCAPDATGAFTQCQALFTCATSLATPLCCATCPIEMSEAPCDAATPCSPGYICNIQVTPSYCCPNMDLSPGGQAAPCDENTPCAPGTACYYTSVGGDNLCHVLIGYTAVDYCVAQGLMPGDSAGPCRMDLPPDMECQPGSTCDETLNPPECICDALKMSMKKHLRHVLLWIYDKNNQIKGDDAVEEIREVYGHDSIGRKTVFRWLKKFRNGDKNVDDLEDDPRSGRPSKFNEKFCPAGTSSIGPCVNGICPSGYTCYGTYPNQMCCGSTAALCLTEDANGPCIDGTCSPGFTCDTTTDQCCPNLGTAVGPCIGGACPTGAYCLQSEQQCYNLLGAIPSTDPCAGLAAGTSIGPCNDDGTCTVATASCLPDDDFVTETCPAGQTSIGPCINGACPAGYTCSGTYPNQVCCGAANAGACDSRDYVGPCIGGNCAPGYTCDVAADQCCPQFDIASGAIGPCLQVAGGYVCPDLPGTTTACKVSDTPSPQCYRLLGAIGGGGTSSDDPCTNGMAGPGEEIGPNPGTCPGTSVPNPLDNEQSCICPG